MNWILRSTATVLDQQANQRVAGLLSLINSRLERGDAIAGLKDLTEILATLGQDTALQQQLRELITGRATDLLDGTPPADALSDLIRFAGSQALHRHLPDLLQLTCRWEQLDTSDCDGVDPRIHWHGLDRLAIATDGARNLVSDLSFDIGADAARALVFEPIDSSDVPDEIGSDVRASLRRALRVTLTGEAKAKAGVEIPIRFGAFGIGGTSSGSARIELYVDCGNDDLVADSFAAAFANLANPFDLPEIHRAFAQGRLRAVRIEAGGSVGLGGSLTVGLREKLFRGTAGGLDASLGVELRFVTARRGDFLANIYPAFPADASRHEVRLDIHRLRASEASASLGLGLTLDLTPVLNALGADLVEKADNAKDLLRRFDDFIPPSAAIREEVDDWLEENLNPEHRELLGSLLGSSPEAGVTQRLGQRLAESLDRTASVWTRQVGDVAAQAAADAINQLPLAADDQPALRKIAAMALEMGLEHAQGELRERIERQLADEEDNALLAHAFARAGESVQPGLDRLDTIAQHIGAQLDRLQGTIANLAKALREGTEIKLRARWRSEEKHSRSTSIQQSLMFRPGIQGASELYRQAMTGSLETLFETLRKAGDDDTGQPVSLISGTLQEFAGVRRESGLELALLDFDLSDTHVMEAGVTIETDAAGNISVRSQSRSRGKRSRLGGYTEYEVVNAFELAAARATRRMSLSLALSQVEQDLETDEAREFFEGFAEPDFRLLSAQQIDAGIAAMPERQERRRGELRAWLELDREQLRRLLQLAPVDHPLTLPELPKSEKRKVFEAAVDALVAGLQFSGARPKWNNLKDHIAKKLDREDVATVLKETFDGGHIAALRPASFTDPIESPRFKTVEEIIARARSLIGVVERMRAIYLSDGTMPVEEYLGRQKTIGDAISGWYQGESLAAGFGGLVSGKVGPFSLAFFKAIADLCAEPAETRPPLLASITVEHDGLERQIPLIIEAGSAAIAPTPAPPLPAHLFSAGPDTRRGTTPKSQEETTMSQFTVRGPVEIRPDPDPNSPSLGTISPGDRVSAPLRLGDWAKVEVSRGDGSTESGWILSADLEEIVGQKVKLHPEPFSDEFIVVTGTVETLIDLLNWKKVRVSVGSEKHSGWIDVNAADSDQDPVIDPDPVTGTTLDLGVNEVFRAPLLKAQEITGIDAAALAALIDAEASKIPSGPAKGQWDPKAFNQRSHAAGLTQFLESTWLDHAKRPATLLNQVAKNKGLVTALNAVASGQQSALLKLRFDAELSIVSAAEYGFSNLKSLDRAGLIPDEASDDQKARLMYLAHHEGPTGAKQFLTQTNSSSLDKFIAQVGRTRALALTQAAGGDVALAYRNWLNGYIDAKIQPETFRKAGPGPVIIARTGSALAKLTGAPIPRSLLGSDQNKELVKEAQEALAEFGYLDPPADGKWGSVSNWALDEFCERSALSIAGGFSPDIARALLNPPQPFPDIKVTNGWFDKVLSYMNQNGYWICRHPDCTNIVYLEGVDPDGTLNDDRPNVFNDLRVVFTIDSSGAPQIKCWEATTEPGTHWTINPMDPRGAARIAFGQYQSWQVGTHRRGTASAHEALVQVEPVSVHRDMNKDFKRTNDRIYTGIFGINQHWGYDAPKNDLGTTSAGCLVGRTKNGHREFMRILKDDARYQARNSYKFLTAVLPGDEVLA